MANWIGHTVDWLILEIAVCLGYQVTLVLYLIKHLMGLITGNEDKQFNTAYMSLMANSICDSLVLDIKEKH